MKPVTEPVAPLALATIPLRLQEPFPSVDMVLKAPVPDVVLYGFGVIVADAGAANTTAARTAAATNAAPRFMNFIIDLLFEFTASTTAVPLPSGDAPTAASRKSCAPSLDDREHVRTAPQHSCATQTDVATAACVP